jgi:glyoxylase-like metal-dependent hydrolase (beta-lactamase superfamily II)
MSSDRLFHGITPINDLDAAWQTRGHGQRLRAVRRAAEGLREEFAGGPRVVAVRTLPLSKLAYPTKYAFYGAAAIPIPLVTMHHKCVLVQFMQDGELRNLLFNPTDVEGAKTAPFFARLVEQFGERLTALIQGSSTPLEAQLHALGLGFADIDYIAFDHFHTQDLRRQLGTDTLPARFPNAILLAPEVEWHDWDDLHPLQRAWFVERGKEGVRKERVAFTSGDLALGDGVMLLRTPGHTSGNRTLFLHTEGGVWGISENGTCADNWSPFDSKISGLAATCRKQDLDVLMNSNTPEGAGDQYTSMILERTIVDRVKRAPVFIQMFPSSEILPTALAPGLSPTLRHREITSGEVARPARRAAAA